MAHEELAALHDAGGTKLLDVLVRPRASSDNAALRNIEGVQPPGLNRQGAFGSGIYQSGTWERMVAVCDVSSYTTRQHAMAALDRAVRLCKSVRFDGWQLPIAEGVGLVERAYLASGGFRSLVRLVPASPHWRYLTGTKAGTGSQAGFTITASGFATSDVGRLLVFASGEEAFITSFTSSTEVGTDVEQTVASSSYTVFDAATGLL